VLQRYQLHIEFCENQVTYLTVEIDTHTHTISLTHILTYTHTITHSHTHTHTHTHTETHKHTPKQRGDFVSIIWFFYFGAWLGRQKGVGELGVKQAQNAIMSLTKQQDSHSCVNEVKNGNCTESETL
jgi:hypothetical protein